MAKSAENRAILPLFSEVEKHHQASALSMIRACRSSKAGQVFLVTGVYGVGKRSLCYWVAQSLLCEERKSDTGCGLCRNCRTLSANQCIDFIEISVEPGESGKQGSLKIDQFRDLRQTAGFSGFGGSYKIILIRDAERLTPQAANSLLKQLEEPPAGWIFLLTATDPALVLPTIVSRCKRIKLKPFSQQVIETLLKKMGLDEQRAKTCAGLSQGSLGRALQLAEAETWELRQRVVTFIQDPRAQFEKLVELASQDVRLFQIILDQLEALVDKRLQECQTSAEEQGFLLKQADKISAVRDRLGLPLNRKLLAQEFLISWIARDSSN